LSKFRFRQAEAISNLWTPSSISDLACGITGYSQYLLKKDSDYQRIGMDQQGAEKKNKSIIALELDTFFSWQSFRECRAKAIRLKRSAVIL
jgi:hypothetical protein